MGNTFIIKGCLHPLIGTLKGTKMQKSTLGFKYYVFPTLPCWNMMFWFFYHVSLTSCL